MKLSFLLFFLVLSGASGSGEPAQQGNEAQRQQQESDKQTAPSDNKPLIEQVIHSPSDGPTANSHTHQTEDQPWKPTDWAIAMFTACLVGVGIAQVVVYYKQAKYMRRGLRLTRQAANATRRSADIADKTVRLLNRPFVSVHFDFPFTPEPNTRQRVVYIIRNNGNTWAFIKLVKSNVWDGSAWSDYESQPFSLPVDQMATQAILAPKQSILDHKLTKELSPDVVRSIQAESHKLMVHGVVIYDNIFRQRHFTRFSVVFKQTAGSKGSGFVFPGDGEPNENDVDQD